MSCKILFVVCEVGPAKYCLPLWNRWLKKSSNSFDWKILTFENIIVSSKLEKFSKHFFKDYDFKKSFESNVSKIGWSPNIIFSSSSYKNIEFESLNFAKKKNVSGIQFFDTWYNYFARLAKTNNKILANKVCVIDQHAYTEAYEEGVKKEVLHIVGQPALEKLEYKKKSRNNSLLFVNQPISRHEQLNFLNYNEKDVWKIVFDAMEEIRDGYKNFYFGKHPDGDYTSLPNKIFKKLDITVLESGQLGINLADTVLGIFSTLMIDAFFLKKKVVSVQPHVAKKNLCILSKKRYIPLASNSEDLIKILTNDQNENYEKIKESLKGSLDRLEKFLENEKN